MACRRPSRRRGTPHPRPRRRFPHRWFFLPFAFLGPRVRRGQPSLCASARRRRRRPPRRRLYARCVCVRAGVSCAPRSPARICPFRNRGASRARRSHPRRSRPMSSDLSRLHRRHRRPRRARVVACDPRATAARCTARSGSCRCPSGTRTRRCPRAPALCTSHASDRAGWGKARTGTRGNFGARSRWMPRRPRDTRRRRRWARPHPTSSPRDRPPQDLNRFVPPTAGFEATKFKCSSQYSGRPGCTYRVEMDGPVCRGQ